MVGKRADVTILLTHLDDVRGVRALQSLSTSSLPPGEIVIADGGSKPEVLDQYRALEPSLDVPIRILDVPGSVAASREQAWAACRSDLVAFLDTDEVADKTWLERLTEPIRTGRADFAAGPTIGLTHATGLERYHSRLEEWFYREYVARDIVYAPMGNTAWRKEIFARLHKLDGHVFDVRLARGAEDFDVNIRALKAGFKGTYVPDAVLRHDHSRLNGARRAVRKKYHYALGEFQVTRRHADFFQNRPPLPAAKGKPWHPIELVEPFTRRWARLRSRRQP